MSTVAAWTVPTSPSPSTAHQMLPHPAIPAGGPQHAYSGPGIAEIKPHNPTGIRDGLRQLHSRRRTFRRAHGKDPDMYLITYWHRPGAAPTRVTFFLLKPLKKHLPDAPRRTGDARSWLASLGVWNRLGSPVDLPGHSARSWARAIGPAARGLLVEPLARRAFFAHPGFRGRATDLAPAKQSQMQGPDVYWRELAEYLYELASELGSVDRAA